MNSDTGCYTRIDTRNWFDRLLCKLFPYKPCELPEAPAYYKDVIVHKVHCDVSFWDRVKILITGKCEVESKIVCENIPGNLVTSSTMRCGKHWH